MQSVPACSVADVAAAARARGLTLGEVVERAMELAGRSHAERLYVGSNFCSQYFLRQSMSLWREAFALCRREGMAATLVVPVVSQRDLAEACQLVEEILTSYGDMVDEITVNDVGMFAYCRQRCGRAINLGRLFFKEPRDPRYADLFETRHAVGLPAVLTGLFSHGEVAGIEIDPTHAALDLSEVRGFLPQVSVGVHMPYCYLSTGNVCEFAGIGRPVREKFRPNAPCAMECARCSVGYGLPYGTRMLKWGRTVYFPNHGCTVCEGEDFRMIVTPVRRAGATPRQRDAKRPHRRVPPGGAHRARGACRRAGRRGVGCACNKGKACGKRRFDGGGRSRAKGRLGGGKHARGNRRPCGSGRAGSGRACGGEPAHGGGRACGSGGAPVNTLVPVNDRAYLGRYARAGGDEFYVGFHDEAWHARFGRAADLNRMTSFLDQANPYSFEEVLSIADEVRALDRRLYVTFNANAYSRAQLDFLFGYFERLREAGAAGVIVSVPEAVEAAADSGLEVVASTMCGVYNAQIACVLRDLGCTRVIVPRDVSLGEVECIMRAVPGLEYEVFLMRNGCIFSDCYCLGRHFKGRNALCFDVRDVRREFFVEGPPALAQAARENNGAYGRFHRAACGLCAVWRFERMGRFRREDSGALGRLGVHFARHRDDPPQRGDCAGLRKRAGVPFSHARAARTRRRLRRGPELLLPGSALRVRVPRGRWAPAAGGRRSRRGPASAGGGWGAPRRARSGDCIGGIPAGGFVCYHGADT